MRPPEDRVRWNVARLRVDDRDGHYESYFQRANHSERPLAFWIRYTALVPRGAPERAVGELWAIVFDGERGRRVAVKERHPLSACVFATDALDVRIASARLREGSLEGSAQSAGHTVAWELGYTAPEPPLLLLPERMYAGGFPKAKSLVGSPLARYRGRLCVDGETLDVDDWIGSQNHNWGTRHTERYAWGQVAGFDGVEDAFLECSSARVRVGPLLTPYITPIVLRLAGREHRLNALMTALRARAQLTPSGGRDAIEWRFASAERGVRVSGRMHAPAGDFVALRYDNPSGTAKICLNTKIASCELEVARGSGPPLRLHTRSRAAFEILGDRDPLGLPIAT